MEETVPIIKIEQVTKIEQVVLDILVELEELKDRIAQLEGTSDFENFGNM